MSIERRRSQFPGRYWVKGLAAMAGYTLLNGLAVFVPVIPGMLTLIALGFLFPLIVRLSVAGTF